MKFYCISHKPPQFKPPTPYCMVSPLHHSSEHIIIPDDYFGDNFHGYFLSEYCQLFGLATHLSKIVDAEPIYIFQYRKFISIKNYHRMSQNISYATPCSSTLAPHLFPTLSDLTGIKDKFILGPLLHVGRIEEQYAKYHIAEDFHRFLISLEKVDGFDSLKIEKFANCPLLIPAPSLGLTNKKIFIKHMKTLKSAWSFFSENFLIPREGYQRRVGGFLLERLHSFLICLEIFENHYDYSTGKHIVISESSIIKPTM